MRRASPQAQIKNPVFTAGARGEGKGGGEGVEEESGKRHRVEADTGAGGLRREEGGQGEMGWDAHGMG